MASEVGVRRHRSVAQGRARRPACSRASMFLIDTVAGSHPPTTKKIKAGPVRREHPYAGLAARPVAARRSRISPSPPARGVPARSRRACSRSRPSSVTRSKTSRFSLSRWPRPVKEALGSMGTDTPIAVLSDRPRHAVRLLPAALRASHQPAARRDPRGTRDERSAVRHRTGRQPARAEPGDSCRQMFAAPRRSSTTTTWRRSCTSTIDGDMPGYKPYVLKGLFKVAGAKRDPRDGSALPEPARPAYASALDEHPCPRSLRRDQRKAPRSSSCRIAIRAPSWRRSRRCCSLTAAVHHHLIREKTRTRISPHRRDR